MDLARVLTGAVVRVSRLVGVDLVYFGSGTFWLAVGQVASTVSAFVLSVVFANMVPIETYGSYKYVLSIAGMFSVFTLPGTVTAVTRSVARGEDGVVRATTRARTVTSLVGTCAALVGAGYYYAGGDMTLALSLTCIALTLPIFDTFTLYNAYWAGKREFQTQTGYHILSLILSTPLLIAVLALTDNLVYILIGYFIPLAAIRYGIYRRVTAHLAPHDATETIRYGTHLSLMSILSVAASNADKFLLWHLLGPTQVAIYAFAIAIPEQLKGPLRGVGDLLLPKFSNMSHAYVQKTLWSTWKKTALYAIGLVLVTAAYVLVAPYIFDLFFPQYADSVRYSQMYALSLVSAIGIIPLTLLAAQKKTVAQYVLNTAQPALQIGLLIMLIPTHGILGAVAALLITRMLMLVFTIVLTMYAFRSSAQ